MIYLNDFIVGIKRELNFGKSSVTSDKATADIIRSINRHRKRVGKAWPWEWLIKSFNVTITSTVQNITLDVDIDRVWAIADNNGDYLQKVSIKEMLRWHTPPSTGEDTNVIGAFCHIGRDTSSGARIIRVLGRPSASDTLPAYGLKVFDDVTVADIATPVNFLPFPDTVMGNVRLFVMSDIERLQGNQAWRSDKQMAQEDLKELIGDEQSDPADDVTSPPPAFYKRGAIMRRAGHVV